MVRQVTEAARKLLYASVIIEECAVKSFIYRYLGAAGGGAGFLIGIKIADYAHASYSVELLLGVLFGGLVAYIGADIGERLEKRRVEAA